MKTIIKIVILLIVSTTLFCADFNLNEFESNVISGRGAALGNISVLGSAGANYVFDNPALLANIRSKDIRLSLRSLSGKSTTSDPYPISEETYPLHAKINGVAFAMPLIVSDKVIGLSLGFRSYYDMSYNKEFNYYVDGYDYSVHYEDEYKMFLNTIVIGGGMEIGTQSLVGMSISFPFLSDGSYEWRGKMPGWSYNQKFEYQHNGTFFTFGAAFKFIENLTIGTRLRTGFKMEVVEKLAGVKNNWEYNVPYELVFSAEYAFDDDLSAFIEYQTRNIGKWEYSDADVNNVELNGNSSGVSDDGYSLNLGVEYGDKIKYRIGGFLRSVPIYTFDTFEFADEWYVITDYNEFGTPEKEVGFSCGLGLQVLNFTLDPYIQYSFMSFKQDVVDYSSDMPYQNFEKLGELKTDHSRFKIGATIGYVFSLY